MPAFDKIVVITQKTALEELIERFNTREQARFYLEHMGTSFESYQEAHEAYQAALQALQEALPEGVRHQFVERSFLPNFLFGETDLIVTLGRDGLVVNTAKYLSSQPLVGLNPDPERVDGVLLPFRTDQASSVLRRVLQGRYAVQLVTMARAGLNNGQSLYAVNDLFIGQKTHLSARYRLSFRGVEEDQSSSGIIVSTGAGSTGWFRSILTGAVGVVSAFDRKKKLEEVRDQYAFDRDSPWLYFTVREPFISKVSAAGLVFGRIEQADSLAVTSQMPQGGVIFSDGIEKDYLEFQSGSIAHIGVADKKVHLVVAS
ncbi:MAG: NAD(+)/NADH kinase [Planctomycetes bacterium]|nr:NAD(+)/NADH kinase [Planctomycetota bacterium]